MSNITKVIRIFVILLYVFCIGQFFLVLAVTKDLKGIDPKLPLMLSAAFGLILSGVVRRSFQDHLLKESTQPLDEKTLKEL